MSKKRMPKNILAECDGIIYLRVEASGIHPLIFFSDGLTVARFGKEKFVYIKLDDAIAWHEKEIAETGGRGGKPKHLEILTKIKAHITRNQPHETTQTNHHLSANQTKIL